MVKKIVSDDFLLMSAKVGLLDIFQIFPTAKNTCALAQILNHRLHDGKK